MIERTCAHPDCTRGVAGINLCCFRHWKLLPYGLRTKINKAVIVHGYGTAEYEVQMIKARRVWAEVVPPLEREDAPAP